jgi:excisionase family DNA binding protein
MGTTTYDHEQFESEPQARNETKPSAFILVIPNTDGPLLELLQQLLAAATARKPELAESKQPDLGFVDRWLEHAAAAECLGVGKSTLYRYAEQGKIEYRKIGNRLQYRRSSLDRFKEQQIRPARRFRPRGIIPATLGSGN